jgi:hypothetical protein
VIAPQTHTSVPSARRLAKATAVSLLVAGVVLVTAILPAEYGIDPLGTGKALGLSNLFGSSGPAHVGAQPAAGPVFPQSAGYKTDAREFKLGPYEYIEFKYEIDQGASIVYDWKATTAVTFNLHTDPAGKPKEASESFEKGEAAEKHGAYVAPYPGLHGWYWENPTGQEVTIRLSTTGFYRSAKEFHHDGATQIHQLSGARPSD